MAFHFHECKFYTALTQKTNINLILYTMLNIHLKIEAKGLLTSNKINALQRINGLNRYCTIKLIYNAFDCDSFILPYRVNKLSKRARRNQI